jgi:hypothetical protein
MYEAGGHGAFCALCPHTGAHIARKDTRARGFRDLARAVTARGHCVHRRRPRGTPLTPNTALLKLTDFGLPWVFGSKSYFARELATGHLHDDRQTHAWIGGVALFVLPRASCRLRRARCPPAPPARTTAARCWLASLPSTDEDVDVAHLAGALVARTSGVGCFVAHHLSARTMPRDGARALGGWLGVRPAIRLSALFVHFIQYMGLLLS